MSMEYPCIYFEKDGKCRKFSDNTAVSYCVMGPCPEQKSSNADRIRAMSDEELAELLISADFCEGCEYCDKVGICRYCEAHPDGVLADGCRQATRKWLQQPAEEESNAD